MMTVGKVFILRVREKDNKALVGVCYTPPKQNEEADEIFS